MLPFIHGGHQRAIDGIRAVVEAKYAKQMKAATSPAERRKLRKRIKAEIEQRVKRQAPPSALY